MGGMSASALRQPATLLPLLVAGLVSAALLAAGAFASDKLSHGEFRLLAIVGGGTSLVGLILLVRTWFTLEARALHLSGDVARLKAGEVHHFAATPAEDPLGELAAAVNELGEELRTRRISMEMERLLDQAMVRETPNGLVITDVRGLVRRYNPAFARLVPFTGDPVGKTPIETVPVKELQEVITETGRTRAPSERNATVGRREVLVRALPLADGEGTLGVVLDITSVRLAERARREFSANVSHELRTPITAVVGYAESLLQDKEQLPGWAVPMVEAIDRNGRRLGALIEDVLHLSRLEARQGDLVLQNEALRPLVSGIVERFLPAARAKGIELTLAGGEAVDARVNIEAFEHALGNLVDNAIKYTPERGNVTVTVARGEGGPMVSVTDSGIGIDPAHHDRIFERFYRVDPGRSRDAGGTGLGLALVKHLCLATGAEVTLTSELGKGSTFTLRLPA